MAETTTSDAVLARLEALTARLDEQAAEIAALKAENARLTATRPSDARSDPEPSSTRQQAVRRPSGAGILKRRGLFAGIAALLGAGLAKLAGPETADATHGGGVDAAALHVGEENLTTAATTLKRTANVSSPSMAFRVLHETSTAPSIMGVTVGGTGVLGSAASAAADPHWGVVGQVGGPFPASFFDRPAGVYGASPDHAGVMGDSRDAPGVVGRSTGSGGTPGVLGHGSGPNGAGVIGLQPGVATPGGNVGAGVYGSGVGAGAGASRYGVFGDTDSSTNPGTMGRNQGTGPGVRGTSPNGTGVVGESTSSIGVHGVSVQNAGVFAQGPIGVYAAGTGVAGVFGGSSGGFGFWGNSAASAGIYGTSTTGPGVRAESTNSFGLHAKSPTYAGVFEGNVYVTGRVIALGGVGASAAVTTTRTLAEDVGEATLTNGKATVALDPAFAEEVKGGRFQVFVTPHDASGRGLAVVARRRDGFDVQELAGGATEPGGAPGRGGNAGFSYRVVARLDGPAGPREAPLAPPDLTTVQPAPPLPEPPRPAEPSEERRRP